MLHFDSDYMRGAHPQIMRRLAETNLEMTSGYGLDPYSARARKLILDCCGLHDAEIHFLAGGTQTNAVIIDALLARHEGVLAAETAHINVHEAGAIEASGHKVLTLPSVDGKLSAEVVEDYIRQFYLDDTFRHMVAPGMVYITHPTELGTLYSRAELTALSDVCRRNGIPLYLDGARLGYGLASPKSDMTLADIARLCDAFYIGGTKVGALFGEAAVVTDRSRVKHLFTLVKRHGALLAKGRLCGIQFETLFTDGLYLEISRHAVHQALKLKEAFITKGYKPYIDSFTNQQFFTLPNEEIGRLRKIATFELWGPMGAVETPVRFVTDWGTTDREIEQLASGL